MEVADERGPRDAASPTGVAFAGVSKEDKSVPPLFYSGDKKEDGKFKRRTPDHRMSVRVAGRTPDRRMSERVAKRSWRSHGDFGISCSSF